MGNVILQTAESVSGLYLIGLLGFALSATGFVGPEAKKLFPKLVTQVTLPPLLFTSVVTAFTRSELGQLIYGSIIPVLSILTVFAVQSLYARRPGHNPKRKGVISVGSATSNTIFIGLPVNIALFGDVAVPYVLLYFFANTTFFWTLGNYTLSLDGPTPAKDVGRNLVFKALLSPPLLGFLTGIALILAEVQPPEFLMDSARLVGGMTSPLALLYIGIALSESSLSSLKPDLDLAMLLAGRFVLSPLAVFLLAQLIFPTLPPLMLKVFLVQSSLPCAATLALMAAYHGSDAPFAGVGVSLSTVLSLLTIPGFMLLFGWLGL
ncbi:MAG: AEC family transporter [Deltaproteobacteria bacterium]|jgi:predicted permease|nr:AEC family transporter [Deltaproteobacteria bacterium]